MIAKAMARARRIGGFPRPLSAESGAAIFALLLLSAWSFRASASQELAPSCANASTGLRVLAVQADGKIVVGGDNMDQSPNNRLLLCRLNRDGSIDSSFHLPRETGGPGVDTAVVQADQKILIGGSFFRLGGSSSRDIARLNPDGSVDSTFHTTANSLVSSLLIQPDGKILVGGAFTAIGAPGAVIPRARIARLSPDGSVDPEFNPGADGQVFALALQPDKKILIGGMFTGLGGEAGTTNRYKIGRINADGSLDEGFNPGAGGNGSPSARDPQTLVNSLVVQDDGKILVGGSFSKLGGATGITTRNGIGRINADGSVDMSFNPGADHMLRAIAVQSDGRILVAGDFSSLGGGLAKTPGVATSSLLRLGRLNRDGTVDAHFNPGANASVSSLVLQPDAKILVAGAFRGLGGGVGASPLKMIGRLNPDGSVDTTFNPWRE